MLHNDFKSSYWLNIISDEADVSNNDFETLQKTVWFKNKKIIY